MVTTSRATQHLTIPLRKPPPPSSSKWPHVNILLGVSTVLIVILLWTSSANYRHQAAQPTTIRIAFVGNSFQFVNDFPRFLPQLALPRHIEQDSVLHGSLSLVTLLQKGNGMRNRWKTGAAWNDTLGLWDYGACTIPQLLIGYDEYLSNGNYRDFYIRDGLNPCFSIYNAAYSADDDVVPFTDDDGVTDDDKYQSSGQEEDEDSAAYLQYTLDTKMTTDDEQPKQWDFVVFNDQSIRPAIVSKRQKTRAVLESTYAPMLLSCGATPVFISTHGYWRADLNLTALYGIQDVPHFTAKLHRGYETYAQTLQATTTLQPRVAPVGVAFLVVWEENPSMWDKFFGHDLYHPSPYGTYLMGCVVHATIFGDLPDAPADNQDIANYFSFSRSMQLSGGSYSVPFPTRQEALYLRWIAKRVVVHKYRPPSFTEAWDMVVEEEADYS